LSCIPRTPTGIPVLDKVLEGGFPQGAVILVAGNPGAGKTTFAATYIYNGAVKYGEPGLYISFVEDRESFISYMRSLGMDFEELEREGLFTYMPIPYTDISKSLETIVFRIMQLARERNVRRVVIDSVTAIAQALRDKPRMRAFLHNTFIYGLKRLGNVTSILIADLPFGSTTIGLGVEEFVVDGVLVLKVQRIEGMVVRYLEIWKLRGTKISRSFIPYTIRRGGFVPVLLDYVELPKPQTDSIGAYTPCLSKLFEYIPLGIAMLIEGESGSGKSLVALELAMNSAMQGHRSLYISLTEPKHVVEQRLRYMYAKALPRIGSRYARLEEIERNLQIVSVDPYEYEANELLEKFVDHITSYEPVTIVVDGVDALRPVKSSPIYIPLVRSFISFARKNKRILAVTVTLPEERIGLTDLDPIADLCLATRKEPYSPKRRVVNVIKARCGAVKEWSTVIVS